MRTEWTPEQVSPTEPAPSDVQLDMPDPTVPLCPSCVDAYRNGIEPGETACESRALDAVAALDREISELQASDRDLERRTR